MMLEDDIMLSVNSDNIILSSSYDDIKLSAKDELRIVLLGRSGVGKSSVGNTILGDGSFTAKCSLQSATQICQRKEIVFNGRRIVVIDTPGIFDTNRSEKDNRAEIISCLVECAPGPHVFILLLRVERDSKENQKLIVTVQKYFSQKILDHIVVLFTRGDDLDDDMTIQDFMNQSDTDNKHQTLKEFIEKCGNRVHVVDNKYWKITENNNRYSFFSILDEVESSESQCQVETEQYNMNEYRNNKFQLNQLMKSVNQILHKNNKQFFQNKALEELGNAIDKELKHLLQEENVESPSDTELSEFKRRARERVRTKVERHLTGVTTGALLGALLGVGVGIAAPVVLVAGLIRAGWRKLTDQRPPSGRAQVRNAVVGTGACAGTAVGAGVVAEIIGAGAEAAALGAGAATGIGLGVGAGVLLAYGAYKGLKSGYNVSKKTDNPSQAGQNVSQTLTNQAQDVLGACWNLGKTDTSTETQRLLNESE